MNMSIDNLNSSAIKVAAQRPIDPSGSSPYLKDASSEQKKNYQVIQDLLLKDEVGKLSFFVSTLSSEEIKRLVNFQIEVVVEPPENNYYMIGSLLTAQSAKACEVLLIAGLELTAPSVEYAPIIHNCFSKDYLEKLAYVLEAGLKIPETSAGLLHSALQVNITPYKYSSATPEKVEAGEQVLTYVANHITAREVQQTDTQFNFIYTLSNLQLRTRKVSAKWPQKVFNKEMEVFKSVYTLLVDKGADVNAKKPIMYMNGQFCDRKIKENFGYDTAITQVAHLGNDELFKHMVGYKPNIEQTGKFIQQLKNCPHPFDKSPYLNILDIQLEKLQLEKELNVVPRGSELDKQPVYKI